MRSPIAACVEQQSGLDIVEEENLVLVAGREGLVADGGGSYLLLAASLQLLKVIDAGSRVGSLRLRL